jgi:hypothetical protein
MMANQIDDKPSLPDGFIECEYLESTLNSSGYGQNYIYANLNVLNKEVEMTLQGNKNQKNSYTFPFGDFQDYLGSGLICYKDKGYAVSSTKLFDIPITEKITVNYKWYHKEVEGVLKNYVSGKIGGTEYEQQRSSSVSGFLKLYIFKPWNTGYYGFVGKIFGCKIYDISDGKRLLIANLVPALRVSDNKPGMYDLVTGQFLTNQGTGEFAYG